MCIHIIGDAINAYLTYRAHADGRPLLTEEQEGEQACLERKKRVASKGPGTESCREEALRKPSERPQLTIEQQCFDDTKPFKPSAYENCLQSKRNPPPPPTREALQQLCNGRKEAEARWRCEKGL